MRTRLTPADLGDLLEQPILAVLATRRRDGSILLAPVWHEWVEGGFHVAIAAGDVKLAHLARDPLVSIVVAEGGLPYRGLEVVGSAAETALAYGETMRRLARRYLGPIPDSVYPDSAVGSVVRIAPGRLRAWDFADDVAAFAAGT